jgi:hypothetical protein
MSKNKFYTVIVLIALTIFLLVGCASPTPEPTALPTATRTNIPTETPTITPTLVPTETPTPTPLPYDIQINLEKTPKSFEETDSYIRLSNFKEGLAVVTQAMLAERDRLNIQENQVPSIFQNGQYTTIDDVEYGFAPTAWIAKIGLYRDNPDENFIFSVTKILDNDGNIMGYLRSDLYKLDDYYTDKFHSDELKGIKVISVYYDKALYETYETMRKQNPTLFEEIEPLETSWQMDFDEYRNDKENQDEYRIHVPLDWKQVDMKDKFFRPELQDEALSYEYGKARKCNSDLNCLESVMIDWINELNKKHVNGLPTSGYYNFK